MWEWRRSGLFKAAGAIMLFFGVSWLALDYFIPAPPSEITVATGPKGTTLDYYGQLYRDALEKAGVQVVLRTTAGGVENFRLINDPKSGVDIAMVGGGGQHSRDAPELVSLGTTFYVPLWVFYSSALSIDDLAQLRGKQVAVGPEGSGVRNQAERLLAEYGINSQNATFVPIAGNAAIAALEAGKVDIAIIFSGAEAPAIGAALKNSGLRLMNFSTAEAITRIFPDMVRIELPKGVGSLHPVNPPGDVTLIGITGNVLVRNTLHPAIMQLMARVLKQVHDRPGLLQKTGEFPKPFDPDFPVSQIAVDYYKNGPSFLQEYLPFWVNIYARRAIAFLVAALAIALPVFSFAPRLYNWLVQERLRRLYHRLRIVEKALQSQPTKKQVEALKTEIADIDLAMDAISPRNSDLYFTLRYHLDRARSRLDELAASQS